MKRILCLMLCSVIMLTNISVATASNTEDAIWAEFYVSANGDDSADGSKDAPFRSIERAKEAVAKINNSMKGDIVVNILPDGGEFFLDQSVVFYPQDSGKNGHRVIYRGIKDERGNRPVLTGGRKVTGFKPSDVYPGIWETTVTDDDILRIRELYVDGKKYFMARTEYLVNGTEYYNEPGSPYKALGMYMSSEYIGLWKNPFDIEFQWTDTWKFSSCGVEDIKVDPNNPDQMIVMMNRSWWSRFVEETDGNLDMKPWKEFMIVNAFELLDTPGEFYFDRVTRKLYCMPYEGTDMYNTDVYAPYQNRLIHVQGHDIDKRTENLTFEGLQLSHTYYDGNMEVETGQSTYIVVNNGSLHNETGAFLADKARGIEIKDNFFFGLAECGIDFKDAVDDSSIIGNAFSDIGSLAIEVGRPDHAGNLTPLHPSTALKDRRLNVINGGMTRVWTTNWTAPGFAGHFALNQWETHPYYLSIHDAHMPTWSADPDSVERGIINYVKYDFTELFTIDQIRVAFSPDIPAECKTGYEILLSNDFQFREGNYDVVATQITMPDEYNDYFPKSDKKYRYLMIRALKPMVLRIAGVWAMTNDRPVHSLYSRPSNITIQNNYIRRVADEQQAAGAINLWWAHDSKVEHNEIIDVPYSGYMCGWFGGKGPNVSVANNIIRNVSLTLEDGGGIYTLMQQEGTHIKENWVDNLFAGKAAFYIDSNSCYFTYDDNVTTSSARYLMDYWEGEGNKGSFFNDFYSDNSAETHVFPIKPIKLSQAGNPVPKAAAVMKKAGLEPEYEHLRNLVTTQPLKIAQWEYYFNEMIRRGPQDPKNYAAYLKGISEACQSIINSDNFGSLPGQYSPEYKYELERALNEFSISSTEKRGNMLQAMRFVNIATSKSMYRLSFDEMVNLVRESIENAEINGKTRGTYSKEAVEAIKTVLKESQNVFESNAEYEKKYSQLQKLEQAYQKFENSKVGSELIYVYADGMEYCDIDEETMTATLYFPQNADFSSERRINIFMNGSGRHDDSIKASLDKEAKINVFIPELQTLDIWTVKAQNMGHDTETKWVNKSLNYDSTKALSNIQYDDYLYLAPRRSAHMNTTLYQEGTVSELRFEPIQIAEDIAPMTFIMGASIAEGLDVDASNERHNRFEVTFEDGKAILTSVSSGKKHVLREIQSKLSGNEENVLNYRLSTKEGLTNIEVWLNGTLIFDEISDLMNTNGYSGILSEYVGVKIY